MTCTILVPNTADVQPQLKRLPLVYSGLKCLFVCVLLQSKWPFGKASSVIMVNYAVKLRALLRGKQSQWAIFSSTSSESSLVVEQTSLTDPGSREHMQACWVRKRWK